jgi:large subunit ribosomal protein L14
MLGLTAKISKCIQLGTRLKCIDNSGAKELELMAVKGYKGKHRRLPKAGVGDIIVCTVKKGDEKVRHTVVYAVIVRQKSPFRRPDGTRVTFTDNAAVLVNQKTYEPVGSEIRTAIAKEVVERFSAIGKIASVVV